MLDQAKRRADRAQFTRALDLLAQAEASDDLQRDDVVELLQIRATVQFALRDTDELDSDLRRLASLDPSFVWGPRTPPALRRAWDGVLDEIDDELEVRVDVDHEPGSVRIRARVRGDVEGLVRATTIHGRAPGGEWLSSDSGELTVPSAGGVEYYVEAVGPGQAVIAGEGTRDDPTYAEPETSVRADEPDLLDIEDDDDDDDGGSAVPWIIVGTVVVLAAAATVVTVLLLSDGEQQTTVLMPVFER